MLLKNTTHYWSFIFDGLTGYAVLCLIFSWFYQENVGNKLINHMFLLAESMRWKTCTFFGMNIIIFGGLTACKRFCRPKPPNKNNKNKETRCCLYYHCNWVEILSCIIINKLYCIMCGVEVNTKTRTLINWLYDRLQIDKRSVAKWRFTWNCSFSSHNSFLVQLDVGIIIC